MRAYSRVGGSTECRECCKTTDEITDDGYCFDCSNEPIVQPDIQAMMVDLIKDLAGRLQEADPKSLRLLVIEAMTEKKHEPAKA